MNLISLKNVSVAYDGKTVLSQVNLDVADDDFIGVIGPNGGGKTTLVKAILGNVPYTGNIEYDSSLRSRGGYAIGYLPQQNLFDRAFPISVSEVVMSGLQSHKRFGVGYGAADRRLAAECMQQMGIDALANRAIGEVSGGQMQRALLCRAVISSPKVLILDEPTTYVDNRFEGELYSLLKELSHKMAIIVVSHDIGTVTTQVKSIVCVNRHVHRHNSNIIIPEQLSNYNCPIQIVTHGTVPHTVLESHD